MFIYQSYPFDTAAHTDYPHLLGKKFKKSKDSLFTEENKTIGLLSDVAPTILELLEIPKPKEMTGESLLKYLL